MSDLKKLYYDLSMLSLFRGLLDKPIFRQFCEFSRAEAKIDRINSYAEMVSEIYKDGGNLTDSVRRMIFEDENIYVKMCASHKNIPCEVASAAAHELDLLSSFAAITADDSEASFLLTIYHPLHQTFAILGTNILVELKA